MAPTSNQAGASASSPAAGDRASALKLLQAAVLVRFLRAARGLLLARLLSPEVFGGYAMIGAIIGPLASLSNLGLTGLLAREASPSPRLVATANWVNRRIVLLAGGMLVAAVAVWSYATGHKALMGAGVVVALATALYLSPQVPLGLLQQRREFRLLAGLDIAFDTVWTVIALALALLTSSIWALVLAELVAQVVRAVAARRLAGTTPRPVKHAEELPHLLRFTSAAVLGSLLWSLAFSLPVLLLQRHTTPAAIGIFSLAITYAQLAALTLGGIGARISLPSLGAALPERRLETAWRYTESISLALAPLTGLLAAAAPPLLVGLAGQRWSAVATPFALLACGVAARVVFPISALATAANRLGLDNRLAGFSITLLLMTELLFGWTSPTRAAAFVAATDVVVIVVAILAAHLVWGPAPGSYRRAIVLWGIAILAGLLAYGVPLGRARDAVDSALRAGIFSLAFLIGVAILPWTRKRYIEEALQLLQLVRGRPLSG